MIDAAITSGLIEAPDLFNLLQAQEDVVVLDASFVLPGTAPEPAQSFLEQHIPGARFFDIEDFSDHASPLPHMLCGPEDFAAKAGALGIGPKTFVVVYGQNGMIMGPPRAWWSFKAYGHNRVAVLDGGLPAWKAAGYRVETGSAPIAAEQKFIATPQPGRILTLAQVQSAPGATIFDARPATRFTGASPEPRPGLHAGHIPGSRNVPCAALADESGRFKSAEAIRALFKAEGLSGQESVILTCGSGVTACALALGLHHVGIDSWGVYDGSWAEWGQYAFLLPIETN